MHGGMLVQVTPITRPAIESYIKKLLRLRTNDNELLLAIAEDNLQQSTMLFQALADGLNLAMSYSTSST